MSGIDIPKLAPSPCCSRIMSNFVGELADAASMKFTNFSAHQPFNLGYKICMCRILDRGAIGFEAKAAPHASEHQIA